MLILFDLSAVFDTVNHDTMLRRLEYSFNIQGKAHLVCILFVWTRENELRERIPVPHDYFFYISLKFARVLRRLFLSVVSVTRVVHFHVNLTCFAA